MKFRIIKGTGQKNYLVTTWPYAAGYDYLIVNIDHMESEHCSILPASIAEDLSNFISSILEDANEI